MARSPSYPQINLQAAIEFVRKVYRGAHRASINSDAVIDLMGYSGKSGRALSAVGALKQYGLLEGRDDAIHVTDLALRLIEPMSDSEYAESALESACSPDLFNDFYREFELRLPSESVLRSLAIRKYDFTDTGAQKLAKNYVSTMQYVKDLKSSLLSDLSLEPEDSSPASAIESDTVEELRPDSGAQRSDGEIKLSQNGATELKFQLSKDSSAVVLMTGDVNEKNIDLLIRYLELTKSAYS